MKNHPLLGHTALVRTDLAHIPVWLRGCSGTILSVQRSRAALYVDLELDHKSSLALEAREVLLLRLPGSLKKVLEARRQSLSPGDIHEIKKVVQLIRLGEEQAAMNVVLMNKQLQGHCLADGVKWMEDHERRKIGRNKKRR